MEEASDVAAITQLQAAYGDAVTRRAWEETAALFLPDCAVRIDRRTGPPLELVGGDALAAFVAASVERFELFLFTILNAVAGVDGEGDGWGRVWLCEVRQDRDDHRVSTAYGLYRDRYRKVDGRWRFAERAYSSLARTGADGAMDVFGLPPA